MPHLAARSPPPRVRLCLVGAVEAGLAPDGIVVAQSHDEILADLQRIITKGDYVLVKGSRGMRMERVIEQLKLLAGG